MAKRDRNLNHEAVKGLTELLEDGKTLGRGCSFHEILVARRGLKIALATLKEVSPSDYSTLCMRLVETTVTDW